MRAKPIPTHCDECGSSFDYLRGPSEFKRYPKHYCLDCRGKGYATKTHGMSRDKKGRMTTEYNMWQNANHRAKRFNVPFDLQPEDIIIPDVCPVLGISLIRSVGNTHTGNSPSLDRIIPELGYVKDNVLVVSYRANTMKSDGTLEDLKNLYEFYKEVIENGYQHRRN